MRIAVAILMAAGLALSAFAEDPVVGDWRGSNGSTFRIPTSTGKFSLTIIMAKGERKTFPAIWDKAGDTFTWIDAQKSKHTAVIEKDHKPIRVRDVGESFPDSPGYWYRGIK